MNNKPKISIITACYNAESSIEETIQSVMSQTYGNIEYIVVDGASTDGTMDIVSQYKKKISHVISEPDKGIYDAFNKGVLMATGEVIHILNAGDFYVDHTVVHDVMNTFIEESDLEYIHGILKTVDSITETSNYYHFPIVSDVETSLLKGYMPPHPAFFLKKKCFEKYGYFVDQYKIAADTRVMISCLIYSKGKFIDKVITEFKQDGVSSDPSYSKLKFEEIVTILNELLHADISITQFYSEKSNINEYLKIWNKLILCKNRGITSCLNKDVYPRVVIFGTKEIAEMLYQDCVKENIDVVGFIDNNPSPFNQQLYGEKIYDSNWLIQNQQLYDVCLFSIEASHDQRIMEQLKSDSATLKLISWKELISSVLRGLEIS